MTPTLFPESDDDPTAPVAAANARLDALRSVPSETADALEARERRAAEAFTRNESAREKRAATKAASVAGKRGRDRMAAAFWDAASRGLSFVSPKVRGLFLRCVEASLANANIRSFLADGAPGWSEASLRSSPVVRVEFEHALVLGTLGESLAFALHKSWGDFLGIDPLEPTDPVDSIRLLAAFKPTHPYQKRFEQRGVLRRKLAREDRKLVTIAMRSTKAGFLKGLDDRQGRRIKARTGLEPGAFWRAAQGLVVYVGPDAPKQLLMWE